MALRYHAADGNLKWVSLLLWTGADPRLPVPRMDDSDVDEEDVETALVAAVRRGQFDVVRKIGIDPARDDVTALINEYCFGPNPDLLEFLIKLGANVRKTQVKITQCAGLSLRLNGAWIRYSEIIPGPTLHCVASRSSRQTARDGTLTIPTGSAAFAERSPKLRLTTQFATWSESSKQAPLSSHSFRR